MLSIFRISKSFLSYNNSKKFLITKANYFHFCNINNKINVQDISNIQDKKQSLSQRINIISEIRQKSQTNQTTENYDNKIRNFNNIKNNENLKEEKKRTEEVIFYIMHDKYSVRPDKEYRISHTTLESTDSKTKMKNLNVIHYANKFFPRDYPYSVQKGYKEFSINHFKSNVIFNTMNFITIQLLINSMGLNINKSNTMMFSAGMNWAIKEGIGQVGAILISTKYSQKISLNAKSFRVCWVIGVNLALLIECTSLIMPQYFLFLATTANFIKLISLASANFSRTIILNNFSVSHNVSEITNKYSLQQNISVFIGNLLGFGLSILLPQTFPITFTLISFLAILNIKISYDSLKYIQLTDLNFQKAALLCLEYINSGNKKILSPQEMLNKEKIFFTKFRAVKFCHISPEIILESKKIGYIIRIIDIFKDKNFIVYVKKRRFLGSIGLRKFSIYTFLKVNADNNDIFIAFLLSVKINLMLQDIKKPAIALNYKDISAIIESANLWLEELDKKALFTDIKNYGWNTNFSTLEEKFYRYHMLIKSV